MTKWCNGSTTDHNTDHHRLRHQNDVNNTPIEELRPASERANKIGQDYDYLASESCSGQKITTDHTKTTLKGCI